MCDLKIHRYCTGKNEVRARDVATNNIVHACIECYDLNQDPAYRPGGKRVLVNDDVTSLTQSPTPNFDYLSPGAGSR